MKSAHRIIIFTIALTASAAAVQALNPFYAVVKAGENALEPELAENLATLTDGEDDSFGVGLGFKIGKFFVFQAEYQDLGTVTAVGSPCVDPDPPCIALAVPLQADTTAISVAFMPHIPLGKRVLLYAKLGVISWDSDITAVGEVAVGLGGNVESEDALYGGGLRLLLPGPFAVFAEYERTADIFETISVGATLGF